MEKKDYIALVDRAKQLSFEYYVLSKPTVADAQFDALVSEIEQAETDHPDEIHHTVNGLTRICLTKHPLTNVPLVSRSVAEILSSSFNDPQHVEQPHVRIKLFLHDSVL